ncbi:hypothetical protein [Streptomyces sp. NPDC005799]|uniref:hypothetical protein n=1 Tax=Streptomyces sp. NPDC005799 TaxID=3154678 RepID=UPI0034023F32
MRSADHMTGADKTAALFEAVGLAEDGHNTVLATVLTGLTVDTSAGRPEVASHGAAARACQALKDLVRAAEGKDLSAFADAGERIRAQCLAENSPLRVF